MSNTKKTATKASAKKAVKAPADRSMSPGKDEAAGATAVAETHLMVRKGRLIFWPDKSVRGSTGYVVRRDDPFALPEYEASLTEAPAGSVPDLVGDQKWITMAVSKFDYHKFGMVAPTEPEPPLEFEPEKEELPTPDA